VLDSAHPTPNYLILPLIIKYNFAYQKTEKRTGGVVQVVECLPNKHQALSSSPSTNTKKKKKDWKEWQIKKRT
jgi:hypothetical protein